MYVSGAVADTNYVSSVSGLSSYPLSSYNKTWSWGLGENVDSSNITSYFSFYEFVPNYSNVLIEGVIDWENSQTTVTETMSSMTDWFGSDNIVDSLLSYELRSGLNMFVPRVSAIDTGVL